MELKRRLSRDLTESKQHLTYSWWGLALRNRKPTRTSWDEHLGSGHRWVFLVPSLPPDRLDGEEMGAVQSLLQHI